MAPPRAKPTPTRVRIRMYQVGFGDCFLVSFEYASPLKDGRSVRHVLIDYGSTNSPPGTPPRLVRRVSELIDEHTGGQIDVVVASHRHEDHLSGFVGKAPLLERLEPSLVVRPWTEDPELDADAKAPRDDPRNFAAMLDAGQEFARLVAARAGDPDTRSLRGLLAASAHGQVSNLAAITRLDTWAEGGRGEYLAAGMKTRMERVVPGIRVRVLGPPTIEQWPEMTKDRTKDPEYWMLQEARLEAAPPLLGSSDQAAQAVVGPDGAPVNVAPGPVSWLVERLQRQQLHSLLRIVRSVDGALNNTSLILLVDAGDKRMLFPGDAQIENWSWALKGPNSKRLRPLLADVDLYKVGHHGSRNASPKTLFRLWEGDREARPMVALMSTLEDVHGDTPRTAVPRRTLVNALERRMTLHTTNGLDPEQPFVELEASTAGGGTFERVGAGPG